MRKSKRCDALFNSRDKLVKDNPQLAGAFAEFIEQLKKYNENVIGQRQKTAQAKEAKFVCR